MCAALTRGRQRNGLSVDNSSIGNERKVAGVASGST
jgi:hypothetical protein